MAGRGLGTLQRKFCENHPSYLSKTPFANGPQDLKMVEVDCKRKRGRKKEQVRLAKPRIRSRTFLPTYLTMYSDGFSSHCMTFATAAPTRTDTSRHIPSRPRHIHLPRAPPQWVWRGRDGRELDTRITEFFYVLLALRQGAFPHLVHLALSISLASPASCLEALNPQLP